MAGLYVMRCNTERWLYDRDILKLCMVSEEPK